VWELALLLLMSLAALFLLCTEPLFPLLPENREACRCDQRWVPAYEYYFLHDRAPRLGRRLLAVLTLNRRQVSFWRRRQAHIRQLPTPCNSPA